MSSKITVLKLVEARKTYKRQFSISEMYRGAVIAPRAMAKLKANKKSKTIDQHFVKRIQLAVTQVNGCAICSYGHAQMALQQGMDKEEIKRFLSEDGAGDFLNADEAKAILFAQHFADSRAFPKQYSYEAIVKEYGSEKAAVILAAAQMMMVGNMYGIPISAFISRWKGKAYHKSNLFYELGMLVAELIILPVGLIHGSIKAALGLTKDRFDTSPDTL